MSDLSPQEQYLLELINRARSDPGAEAARLGISLNQGLTPGTISAAAKQPLAGNDFLNKAAADHSAWMLATDIFSHTGAGGASAGDRIEAAGYTNWRTWGENIAYRGGGNVRSVETVEGHHDGLFRSPGHRRNLLNDGFTEIGLGQEFGRFERFNASMLTEKFASDRGDPFLLGVVYDDLDGDDFFDPGEELPGVRVSVEGHGATRTGEGGGYEIRVDEGVTVVVTFSGGGIGGPVTCEVVIGGENVKFDIRLGEIAATPEPPSPEPPAPQPPAPEEPGPEDPAPWPPETPAEPGLRPPEEPETPTGPTPPAPALTPDTHAGGASDDRLNGGMEADRMLGRAGDDVLRGRGGDDDLRGQRGEDRLLGGHGDDTLRGGGGDDTLKGGPGADRLIGGGGADRMVGGGGEDYLIAGRGGDWMRGGAGADQFEFNARAGGNVIADFRPGLDQIVVRGGAQDFADLDIDAARNGADISFGATEIRLLRVDPGDLTPDDFVFL